MSGESKILLDQEDGVGSILINNPQRANAISLDMWRALAVSAQSLAAADDLRVVIVRGVGGKAFTAGADISEFDDNRASGVAVAAYDDAVAAACQGIAALAVPTVAIIEGFCIGGGVALALSCDLRLAANDARFAIPAARLGVAYGFDMVAQLVGVVGPARAKEMLFTAAMVDASDGLVMGLVNQVAPEDGLEALAGEYTSMLAANAPLTLAAAKLAVGEAMRGLEQRDMAKVAAVEAACVASEDYVEGRRAFQAGRPPCFRGR